MDARELLRHLADLDALIWVEGEKIKWDAPPGVIQGEILERMRENKGAILALLMARETEGNLKGRAAEVSLPSPKIVKRGEGDYPSVFRPCRISEVYGQDETRRAIAYGLNTGTLAHALLFEGISGTGKTTMGRLIAMGLNCETGPTSEPCCECNHCKDVLNGNSFAYRELDAAYLPGVENIRKMSQDFSCGSLGGERFTITLFDECHMLSPEAQAALLKSTEDVRAHVYFIFCTTTPKKVLKTLQNRCQQFKFRKLSDQEIRILLTDVCAIEKLEADLSCLKEIIREAGGMPRNALSVLHKAVASGNIKRTDSGLVVLQRVD